MESEANLGYITRPWPQNKELGFIQGHACFPDSQTSLVGIGRNSCKFKPTSLAGTAKMTSQVHLIKVMRTQLSDSN